MPMSIFFEIACKWLLLASIALLAWTAYHKDDLPNPDYYDISQLEAPRQTATDQSAFSTTVNGQEYTITPKFNYELDGVVVSYNNADGFGDIWHHKRWQDFLNLRDLCVIWGENVSSGIYQKLAFSHDTWTCWVSWRDNETGAQFKGNQLSNNHLLAEDDQIKAALINAEPGDHIRLKGVLAEYANKNNGFFRGTSTNRDDSGNGACETVYLEQFEIINKANRKIRRLYTLSKWLIALFGLGFCIAFVVAPVRNR